RLGHALEAAGEHDRRAELADAAGEGERGAGREAAARKGQRDPDERACRAGAERARGVEQRAVERFERRDRLAEVEGARDVGDGDHHGRLREAHADAEGVEGAAEEAEAPEGGEERDPRDRGREHERELHERDHQLAAAEPTREEVRGGGADGKDQRLRDRARLQRDDDGVGGHGVAELAEELAGRDTDEDRRERQEEERERNRAGEDEARGKEPAADHRSTMTDVDLTIAVAARPGFRSSSSAASRVMIATTRAGAVTSSSTRARNPSISTARTTPLKRLRALSSSVAWSRRRLTSDAGTTRRFAESRCVRIRPARSQRRSVSRLIPSARAASLAVWRCSSLM